MNDVSYRFSRNLRALRKQHGISADLLAEMIGKSRTLVSMIENGRTNVTLDTAAAIAREMGTTVDEMIRHPDPCPAEQEAYRSALRDVIAILDLDDNGIMHDPTVAVLNLAREKRIDIWDRPGETDGAQ